MVRQVGHGNFYFEKHSCNLTNRQKFKEIRLKINGTELKYHKQVKFLGLFFDDRLTWLDHIKFIEDKCKSRLNLLRSLTEVSWGQVRALC